MNLRYFLHISPLLLGLAAPVLGGDHAQVLEQTQVLESGHAALHADTTQTDDISVLKAKKVKPLSTALARDFNENALNSKALEESARELFKQQQRVHAQLELLKNAQREPSESESKRKSAQQQKQMGSKRAVNASLSVARLDSVEEIQKNLARIETDAMSTINDSGMAYRDKLKRLADLSTKLDPVFAGISRFSSADCCLYDEDTCDKHKQQYAVSAQARALNKMIKGLQDVLQQADVIVRKIDSAAECHNSKMRIKKLHEINQMIEAALKQYPQEKLLLQLQQRCSTINQDANPLDIKKLSEAGQQHKKRLDDINEQIKKIGDIEDRQERFKNMSGTVKELHNLLESCQYFNKIDEDLNSDLYDQIEKGKIKLHQAKPEQLKINGLQQEMDTIYGQVEDRTRDLEQRLKSEYQEQVTSIANHIDDDASLEERDKMLGALKEQLASLVEALPVMNERFRALHGKFDVDKIKWPLNNPNQELSAAEQDYAKDINTLIEGLKSLRIKNEPEDVLKKRLSEIREQYNMILQNPAEKFKDVLAQIMNVLVFKGIEIERELEQTYAKRLAAINSENIKDFVTSLPRLKNGVLNYEQETIAIKPKEKTKSSWFLGTAITTGIIAAVACLYWYFNRTAQPMTSVSMN